MITHFHIQNFKCLQDVEGTLGPFTVLVGPNDSGKTSLFDALRLLGRTAQAGLQEAFTGGHSLPSLVWRRDATRSIQWDVRGDAGGVPFRYLLGLSPAGHVTAEQAWASDAPLINIYPSSPRPDTSPVPVTRVVTAPGQPNQPIGIPPTHTALCVLASNGKPPFQRIREALCSTTVYKLDPDALRRQGTPQAEPVLSSTGDNLVAVLDDIWSGPDPAARAAIEHALNEAIGSIKGITLPVVRAPGLGATGPVTKALEFVLAGEERPPVAIPAALASDGAVLLSAFLALAYGDTPELLFIEEPENGLHYSRAKQVIELLRKVSAGEVGNRARQVIVATHSPIFLNLVRPEEVRIFRRGEGGGVQITPMQDVPNIKPLLDEFAPGELWYLFGEEGLVKGGQQ